MVGQTTYIHIMSYAAIFVLDLCLLTVCSFQVGKKPRMQNNVYKITSLKKKKAVKYIHKFTCVRVRMEKDVKVQNS